MVVVCISALNSDEILFCIFNGVENKDSVNHLEGRDSVERLVLVVANCGLGALCAVGSDSGNLNGVITGRHSAEVDLVHDLADVL